MAGEKPKWETDDAVHRGENADRLLDEYGESLASRLDDPGLRAQLEADIASLKGTSAGAALGTQKTATAREREIAADAHDLIMVFRTAVRRSPNGTPTLKRAIGVGEHLDPGDTQGILDTLAAVAANAAGVRACRVAPEDIAEAATLATNLQAADGGQSSAMQARTGSTDDRIDAQLRLEAEIDAVSVAGTLAFRKNPAVRARFEALVSHDGPADDGGGGGGGAGGGPTT